MNTAIAILSYGRADAIPTYMMLEGRTNLPVWVYVSDDDKQAQKYELKYPNVVIFNKKDIRGTFDLGTNAPLWKHSIYARNYILRDMTEKGYDAVWMIDDDIKEIRLRYPINGKCPSVIPSSLDNTFRYYEDFLFSSRHLSAFASYHAGGMFGASSFRSKRWMCQCMLLKLPAETLFNGICDDMRMSIDLAERGFLSYALPFAVIYAQEEMGKNAMKYSKSFYDLFASMYVVCPSGMAIKMRKEITAPIRMNKHVFPKLIPQSFKKL